MSNSFLLAASLTLVVILSVSCGPTDRTKATAVPTTQPFAVVQSPTVVTTPSPEQPAKMVVANTDVMGAYIRRTPTMEDTIRAWPDGTEMQVIGDDKVAGSRTWRRVKDPAGNEGWIPAEFLTAVAVPAAQPVQKEATTPQKPVLPEYKVLNEEISDTALKAQVLTNVLVSGELTEQGLRDLLTQLYNSIRQRTGFKYYPSPTAIYIYAFTSKEHADSGMGQWIAMLEKSHVATSPSISINKLQLAQVGVPPEDRFGLSEQKRMQIWSEYYLAETRAEDEGEKQYPVDPTQSMTVGQSLTLTKGTNLMPEINPKDPLAAMQNVKWLAPGTKITVVRIDTSQENPWYWVRVMTASNATIGEGWINSIALINQAPIDFKEQVSKQSQVRNSLIEKYTAELAAKYGITVDQLEAIKVEAVQKNWPLPKR
jgi:hypothetical protein